ncbi:DUF748 domain-containing protein [Noviherbaspirillum denitrificans]|uniref:AsmA domain-containing protein n=1 Tax=Noviherbaspirillum denitrificans TaxID=1968433 RepID=A0A254TJG4_9BURK|nr:DUF748 domain-containing protein [Noviherbaspirillum denitrificans]OWW19848.1 hypothetical protein AYR66_10380 [Noviherbaspirillum denitrificans]
MKAGKRTLVIAIAAAGALVIAAVIGLQFATRMLKEQVQQALGPESEVGEIVVGMSSIEIRRIRIAAPAGWPAPDTLRAERVVVRPDLLGLFSARIHVPAILVENAYVSAQRSRDGKLRLLPSLLEKKGGEAGQAQPKEVSIGTIELRNGELEFFDASVRQPAHKTRLEQLHARVEDLRLPGLASRTAIQIDGQVKGVQRNGKLSITGWAELASRNSELATKLQGVDLVALQPYLIKASETGVRKGALDLRLKSTVRNNRLHAPGSITLTGLELAPASGPFNTFMGVPRQAVVAALKNRKDQISIDFTLDGNLDDPKFSLNESFALRIGTAVAETLGISIEGLAKGVGSAAEGIGGVVKKLFGK